MRRGSPTKLSLSFVQYWMQNLYDLTEKRGIHH